MDSGNALPFDLWTAAYWHSRLGRKGAIEPLVSVGITVGNAPNSTPADVMLRTLAPEAKYLKLDDREEFRRHYRYKLHRTTVPVIRSRLMEVYERFGQQALVLCCFEDVQNSDQWCHRTMFAEWWEEQTGQKVPELPFPRQVLEPEPSEQGKLL